MKASRFEDESSRANVLGNQASKREEKKMAKKKSIMDYFPKGLTPRPVQEALLLEIERRWNSYDVFVINAPVALGKSAIATTIADWQGRARILTPTNILVDQYQGIQKVKGSTQFTCESGDTCWKVKQNCQRYCQQCPFPKQFQKGKTAAKTISTYHLLTPMKSQRKVHILDEAHNVVPFLREGHTKDIWPHKLGIPFKCLGNWHKTKDWLARQGDLHPQADEMASELFSKDPLFIYEWGEEVWKGGGTIYGEVCRRGEPSIIPVIRKYPIQINNVHNPLWLPEGRQKLILMSGTIGKADLYELGLEQKKTIYIEAQSPIPPERRPIYTDYVGSISRGNMGVMLTRIRDKLSKMLEERPDKGFVHMPYAMAERLRQTFQHPRLLWHSSATTQSTLEAFKASKDKVMIGSGLYEGVSLDYDLARWQVISKVPWPSLASPLQVYWTKRDPLYYQWTTLKSLMQASGRVCRQPDDRGDTIILDQSFERLKDHSLAPQWFRDSITAGRK